MRIPTHLAVEISDAIDAFFTLGILPDRILVGAEGQVTLCLFGAETLPGGAHVRRARLTFEDGGVCLALEHQQDDTATGELADVSESLRDKTIQSAVIRRMLEHVS